MREYYSYKEKKTTTVQINMIITMPEGTHVSKLLKTELFLLFCSANIYEPGYKHILTRDIASYSIWLVYF